MKVLLVYPETPATFYSFKNALRFVSKKSAEPPLGLITIAPMLPKTWEKELIDTNVTKLSDSDIISSDYVFISGMDIHRDSFNKIVKRCNQLGTKVVAGGPMVTFAPDSFLGIDHLILNEAEITLPLFLNDLENGCPKKIYSSDLYPDISTTPQPDWSLLDMKKYASMSVQYSRGCPYNCEFCSITKLNGRIPRTKSKEQFINELDSLFEAGWRGGVFIVDDNFIGNKRKLKEEIIPAMKDWGEKHKFPFKYTTEVSINIADDDNLLSEMHKAGFLYLFVGIESPNDASLLECGKSQNRNRDMYESIKKMQRHGFVVSGGFIVGFDNDKPEIFANQFEFIKNCGITTAMVGLLNAPHGSRLYERMNKEKRLLGFISGNNMDCSINFIPKMDYQFLIKGYKELLTSLYSSKEYYERLKIFLSDFPNTGLITKRISVGEIKAFLKSIFILGIKEKGKLYYWKLLFLSVFKHPKKFQIAMTLAVYGYHFRKVAESI